MNMSDDHLEELEPTGDLHPENKKSLLWKIKLGSIGLLVVLVVLIVIVLFQNTETVTTKFLFVTFEMPRAALLMLTFLLGAAAGVLVAFLRPWKMHKS